MKARTLARILAVTTALMVGMTVLVLPALAEAAVGTASIAAAQRDNNVAGTPEDAFDITVTNPTLNAQSLPAPAVNLVLVDLPRTTFTPVQGIAPAGWTARTNMSTNSVIFEATSGNLARGASAVFGIRANIGRPPGDQDRRWRVYLSDDGGSQSLTEAEPGTPGALNTKIRVARVLGISLISPPLATDHDVTQQQSATARVRIENAGSANPLTLTPSLTSNRTGQESISCPASVAINAQSEGFVDCAVTFGNKANVTLTGDVSSESPPADGIAAASPVINVMSAAGATYRGLTLQPTDVQKLKPVAFRVSINKTGDVSAALDVASSLFKFGPNEEYKAGLVSPSSLQAGGATIVLEFESKPIPDLPDGGYAPTVILKGTDQNGIPVDLTVNVTDLINLDSIGPEILPTLTPPPTTVQGATAAVKNGATLTLGGTIKDRGVACGACIITAAVLQQYDRNGAYMGTDKDITVNVTNSGGNLSGSYTGNYDPDAFSTRLVVAGADPAGNPATNSSNLVEVDNVAPVLSGGLTGGGTNNRREITVNISELVRARTDTMLATDWTCDGFVVTTAVPSPAVLGFNKVTLTVDKDIPRNATPTCDYEVLNQRRAHDRVQFDLADMATQISDGILPLAPVLDQVGGMPEQDNEFFTNSSTPVAVVSGVEGGDTARVYRDTNGNGQIDGTDSKLGEATATEGQTSVNVTLTGLPNSDTPGVKLLLQNEDPSHNLGPLTAETLNLDYTAPKIAAVAVTGNTAAVTFAEPLTQVSGKAGRNAPLDWQAWNRFDAFNEDPYRAKSVSGTGAARSLNEGNWGTAPINRVQYDFQGPVDQRYKDRAGNDALNQVFDF